MYNENKTNTRHPDTQENQRKGEGGAINRLSENEDEVTGEVQGEGNVRSREEGTPIEEVESADQGQPQNREQQNENQGQNAPPRQGYQTHSNQKSNSQNDAARKDQNHPSKPGQEMNETEDETAAQNLQKGNDQRQNKPGADANPQNRNQQPPRPGSQPAQRTSGNQDQDMQERDDEGTSEDYKNENRNVERGSLNSQENVNRTASEGLNSDEKDIATGSQPNKGNQGQKPSGVRK